MSKKKIEDNGTGFQSVENALSRTEQYIEENQKSLTIIILAIVVVVGGYLAYKKFYLEPNNREALSAMYVAEQYFQKDSFKLALNGDGLNYGFMNIIDEYGITKAANLSHYYAGICELRLGNYEEAIKNLEKFDGHDVMVGTIALGAIGDCYVELKNYEKAASYYMKASLRKKNAFTSPLYLKKAGLVYEEMKDFDKALQAYETIRKDYPESEEGKVIDKYIATIKVKMQ
jgi:tetratricopeptide (TPR) repeat protein